MKSIIRPIFLVALCAILLNLQACSGSGQADQGQGAGARGQRGNGGRGGAGRGSDQEITVKTTPVLRISVQRSVDLAGSLVSPDQVRVSSEVGGFIASVNADLGQEVQAGQILMQLDTRELQLAVDRAESSLRQTEAQLGIDNTRSSAIPPDEQIASVRTAIANRDDARQKLAQTQELVTRGLLPKTDQDTNETRLKIADAALQAAIEDVRSLKASLQDRRAAHELAKKKLADAAIRAPVSGAISERLVQRGEFIRENTQVATIVQLNPLRLQTGVQEKYANVIRRSLPVEFQVESYPDEVFHGTVYNISPSIIQETRTFPVEVLVPNPNRKLKPGFFAKGAIFTQRDENVMAVPQEAISTLAGVSSVYVIEDGVVKQQNVILGVQQGSAFEIVSGLQGNEILAASNLNEITTGMRVSPAGPSQSSGPSETRAPAGTEAEDGSERGERRGGQRRGIEGGE